MMGTHYLSKFSGGKCELKVRPRHERSSLGEFSKSKEYGQLDDSTTAPSERNLRLFISLTIDVTRLVLTG